MPSTAQPSPTPKTTPSSGRDDRALLDAVRRGDPTAMGELFVRHRDHVHRYVASLAWGGSADEVVSESFARMLRAIRNGAGPRDHPRRYLFVTARSVVIAKSAQERRRRAADRAFAAVPHPASTGSDTVASAVQEAFSSLSLRQQTVLWMTEVEDRPASEISEVLGISLGAVYALGLRSRRNMRRAYLEALALDAAPSSPVPIGAEATQVGTAGAGPTS